jgi:citrate synthase
VHGGAGEQCVTLYDDIAARLPPGEVSVGELRAAAGSAIDALAAAGTEHVPGFGHRFHPVDPRAPRLLALVDAAAEQGVVGGRFATIGRAVEAVLAQRKQHAIPMNIDGATAVIFAELGFPPPLCRGLFVLSRSVGALAHAWEEMQSGERNKGPIPRHLLWTYSGQRPRVLPNEP